VLQVFVFTILSDTTDIQWDWWSIK